MRFAPDKDFASYTIRAYQSRQVKILAPVESTAAVTENQAKNDEITLTHSFIIAPKQLKENWPPQKIAELTERHLQAVIDLQPELVLLGTGKSLEFPSPSITQSLFTKGIGVEIMDTAAACRTYNVLMHEGRKVVAALIVN